MASIWIQRSGEAQAKKLKGHLDTAIAKRLFDQYLVWWEQDARQQADRVFKYEAILKRNDKIRALIFVEFHSVPSAEEPGQPKRKATA
jgi:hypothetical protein